jgi:hypothetical protein
MVADLPGVGLLCGGALGREAPLLGLGGENGDREKLFFRWDRVGLWGTG